MPIKDPEQRKAAQRAAMAKKRAKEKEAAPAAGKGNGGQRARNWSFVVYPDSAPENWQEILANLHVPVGISPIHDKDVNADGSPKKPHYHIALAFKSMKSYSQILEISTSLNATKKVEVIRDMKGMVRYFIHRDNPEKCQDYKASDIVTLGGFDAQEYLKPTASEGLVLQREMLDFCINYGVVEFSDLVSYALREREDWMQELNRSSFLIKEFVKSCRFSKRRPVNPVTGEVYETLRDKAEAAELAANEAKAAQNEAKMDELKEKMKQVFGKDNNLQ